MLVLPLSILIDLQSPPVGARRAAKSGLLDLRSIESISLRRAYIRTHGDPGSDDGQSLN